MSTVGLFTPRSPDGRAEWRIVLDLFLAVPKGGIVTFNQLSNALQRHIDDERHAIYAAVGRAARELRATHQRSVASVPTVGYRVLEASEHEVQAFGYHKQASRKMNTAIAVLRSADLDDLTPQQRIRTMAATAALSGMASALTHVAREQDRQARALMELQARVGQLETLDAEQIIEDAEIDESEVPQEGTEST